MAFLLHKTPASSNALILLAAVPLSPSIIAPACPIRLPGGGCHTGYVCYNGFCLYFLFMLLCCFFFSIYLLFHLSLPLQQYPHHLQTSVKTFAKSRPTTGSPPIPIHVLFSHSGIGYLVRQLHKSEFRS